LASLWPNGSDQQLATLREPHRRILSRVRCIAWLEPRRQQGQANACFDSHSEQIMRGPAAIDGIRHHAGKSGRTPSCSNNGEDLNGLGDQASDSEAQKKATIGRAELGDAQRPIRLDAQDTADGFWEEQAEAAEHHGRNGSAVRQQHHRGASPFIALTIAISGSRPWTHHTVRFYRESAASLGSGIATRLPDKRNASGAKTSGTRKIKDVVMAGPRPLRATSRGAFVATMKTPHTIEALASKRATTFQNPSPE
jgi:hypothetical protein